MWVFFGTIPRWSQLSSQFKQNTQIKTITLTFYVFFGQNNQMLGRRCIWMFSSHLHFICQSWVGLDWNGLPWYFFLYFHFSRWLENCFEERDMGQGSSESWKDASPGMPLTFAPPQNLISEPTNPDFRRHKSRFPRQQILAFEGEIWADVDAGGRQVAAGAPVQSKDDPRKMTRAAFPKDSHTSNSCLPFSFYRFEANFQALKSWKRSLNLPIHISFWNKSDLHQANCIFRGCFHHLECNTSMFDWARIAHKDFPGNDSCHELGPGF